MTDKDTPVTRDLSDYQEKYLLYRELRLKHEALGKQVEALKEEFRALMGDATLGVIEGETVFTYEPTKAFRWSEFAADNPVLAKTYVKPEIREVPDLESLAANHPALYARYRSRQFVTKKVV